MNTVIKIWEITGNHVKPAEQDTFAADHLEKHLEDWIAESPEILGESLVVIARQHRVPGIGILDLLAVSKTGELVIIELKRGMAPREAVAQALDYASWLYKLSVSEILEIAESTLNRPLRDAFEEQFGIPDLTIAPGNHRILVVGPQLDASAERIIHYLAERSAIPINAIFFRYAKLANGGKLLARSILVPESVLPSSGLAKKMTEPALLAMALKNKTVQMVEAFRFLAKVEEEVWETPSRTFGGSFRYWRRDTDNADRMMFGVNVSGNRRKVPSGQLDIWIPVGTFQKVFAVSEKQSRLMLKLLKGSQIVGKDCIVRVNSAKAASAVVRQLQAWFKKYPSPEQ